ncbi:hypothetical protein AJ79_03553 [Helicocarpus griseus UAMH5409]|uniref:DUF7587 domain-containing protein n=1 Tax=Helicocarpus griseus UAMH5409 TaxID=1447875 RepID=A0A2B7XX13_9EURO|nr:hypothetical protein AJ79_03553 [Helicocarpus griseus UAMH5409]
MEPNQLPSPSTEYPEFLDFSKIPILRHSWSGPEREVLSVLRHFYILPAKQETSIFNSMFAASIKDEGFPDGLPMSRINAQLNDMKRLENPIWVSVNATPLPNDDAGKDDAGEDDAREDEDDEYKECRHVIQLVANELGIELCRRTGPSAQCTKRYKGFELLRSFFNTDVYPYVTPAEPDVEPEPEDVEAECDDEQELDSDIPPTPIRKSGKRSRYWGKRAKPRILYRFYNTESSGINNPKGFSAGLWATGPSHIPNACLYDQRVLEAMAKTHLSRYNIKSPFVSTSSGFLVTFHKLLTQGKDAKMSIIDASKLDQRGLFSAQEILYKDPLGTDITPGYCGWAEWLVWGSIPEEAIVCTISEFRLLEIANVYPDIESVLQVKMIRMFPLNRSELKKHLWKTPTKIDRPDGLIVGNFLKIINLPEEYAEDVGWRISQGWHFTYKDKAGTSRYLDGVRQGYAKRSSPMTGSKPSSVLYPTPPVTPEKPETQPEVIVIDDTDDDTEDDMHEEQGSEMEEEEEDDEDEEHEVAEYGEDNEEDEWGEVPSWKKEQNYQEEDYQEGVYEHVNEELKEEHDSVDRFAEELRQTVATPTPRSLDIAQRYMWKTVKIETEAGNEMTVSTFELNKEKAAEGMMDIEMSDVGSEIMNWAFETDRERVNQMMGW